jgi:hypothetical protein
VALRVDQVGRHVDATPALTVLMAEGCPAWVATELVAAMQAGVGEARRQEAAPEE